MPRQVSTLFLEDWLRNGAENIIGSDTVRKTSEISAQRIIQAWADLRDCLQKGEYNPRILDSLKSLVNSKASLYVADPQAKLLISIISSPNISLPHDLYPLIIGLLYIWVRKSSKPSLELMESAIEVISRAFEERFDPKQNVSLFAEIILLIGAFCFVPSMSENTKTVCMNLLCKMLEEQYRLVGSVGELFPDVLAGIGYALSSSREAYFTRLLSFLFGTWVTLESPLNIFHALVILHLVEWVVFRFISSSASKKIEIFISEVIENSDPNYNTCSILMATGGAIRACNRPLKPGERLNVISRLRISAENRMELIASNLVSKIVPFSNNSIQDCEVRFLIHCLSLGASRSGGLNSTRGKLLLSLALALMIEVFPLRSFYSKILESSVSDFSSLTFNFVKKHQEGVLFKEAGSITGIFCNLYATSKDEDKSKVEDLIWSFCHEIYCGHRRVGLLLKGISDELLSDLEKIGESAFLMVVVFALSVTKYRLSSRFPREVQIDCSVKILVSFSCMEYFRRIRLSEYMEAIRSAVVSVQENDIACVSFVESLPSYVDLTNPEGFHHLGNGNYIWSKDEVQTTRILFYLRVIPTCINRLPSDVFRKFVASTMFLYLGHPNNKVARCSHSVFSSFMASEKDSDSNDRILLKEQLVFYYMRRSLEAYPGITPFDGLTSGVSSLVRHLPAGSPSIYYCIHCLVEKANVLCREIKTREDSEWWKNWQGESDPCKKFMELLLQLVSMVDIQVLPELMKLLAQFIIQLPKDGQNMVLNELYALVSESDDVTRKPTLVSWLQSISYLSSQPTTTYETRSEVSKRVNSTSLQNVIARL